jgi:hypothetical protein
MRQKKTAHSRKT